MYNQLLDKIRHYMCFRQPEKQSDPIELFARKILRSGRGKDYLERLIKDCVREFPHRECTIFRQVMHLLLILV